MRHRRQRRFSRQHKLALPRKSWNLPHDIVLLGLIFRLPLRGSLRDLRCIQGCWDPHDDVRGEEFAAVVGFDGDAVLYLRLADLVHNSMDLEGKIDILSGSVAHKLKLPVWRYERDDSIGIKLPQLDALMELAIFQRHAASSGLCSFRTSRISRWRGKVVAIQQEPVVEPKLAFWCAGEVGAHDDLAVDVGAEDGPCCGHEEVDILDYIDKGFVLAILDV